MDIDQEAIDQLVLNPAEALNVEIKRWIDLSTSEGQAKIVKACLALYNRNGGYLVVGFDDKTLQPDAGNQPADVRRSFHVDDVQSLISRFAQDLFEIGVGFSNREGIDYPVIVVPPGVKAPVAAKRSLSGGGHSEFIKVGDVYFRTLNASGIVSTSVARPQDWRDIVGICFDNREADIGAFLRRQLTGVDRNSLADALLQIGFIPGISAVSAAPTLRDTAIDLLAKGNERFRLAFEARKPDAEAAKLAEVLTWEVALVVHPEFPPRVADEAFLGEVLGSNPRYTGWPVWLDSRASSDRANRPFRTVDGWEALVVSLEAWSPRLDFMCFDPAGRFYLRRALQDDLHPSKVAPGAALDPILVIVRVAEAIAVGLSIARNVAGVDGDAPQQLGFAFRWRKLKGRVLDTWAFPMVGMIGAPQSQVDEVATFVEIPADTPVSAIAPFVDEATGELFALFDGERIPPNAIELWTTRLLERRLNG